MGSDRLACHTKVLSSADTEASVNEGAHLPGRSGPFLNHIGELSFHPHPQLMWGRSSPGVAKGSPFALSRMLLCWSSLSHPCLHITNTWTAFKIPNVQDASQAN